MGIKVKIIEDKKLHVATTPVAEVVQKNTLPTCWPLKGFTKFPLKRLAKSIFKKVC